VSDSSFVPVSNRNRLTAGLCSSSFVYGFVVALLGVVEKPLGDTLQLTTEQTSNFALFINFPVLLMLFSTGILLQKIGKKVMIAGGAFLIGMSLVVIGQTGSYAIACLAFAILGFGGGGINGAANTMIHDLYPENPSRALNLVNTFFGVGAIFLPFVGAAMLATLGLSGLTIIAMCLCMFPAIYLGLSKFPPPGISERFEFAAAKKALSSLLVVLFSAIMFFYIALEFSTGMWSNRFFQVAHGVESSVALYYVAGYWLMLFIGRLVSARLLNNVSGSKLLIFAAIGSCLGLAVQATASTALLSVAGLWLTGLCFAPIFPTTLGVAGTQFKDTVGTVFGVTIGIGIIGSMVLPKLIGNTWDDADPAKAIWFLFGFAVLLFVTQIFVHIKVSKAPVEAEA
jgi:fucose permease